MKNRLAIPLKVCRSLPVAVLVVLLAIGSGYGADSMDVPSITPLSEGSSDWLNKKPGIPGERRGFIERVDSDKGIVVISDATKRLAPNARYTRRYNGTPIFLSEFQPGTYVGYIVNEKAEVATMWIAE